MLSTFEDLKKSYAVLKKNQRWLNLATDGFGMLVIFFMIPLMMLISSFNPFNLILLISGIVLTIVYGLIIFKAYRYRHHPPLENHRLIFLQFFGPYQKLHELKQCYLLKQSELYENSKNLAISAISSLIVSIEEWASPSAPTELIKIQNEIKNGLKENILETIKVRDEKKFCDFADYVLQTCDILHKRDLTYIEWINFKEKIFEYGTKPEKESIIPKTDLKPRIRSYAQSRGTIGAVVWVLSFVILYLDEQGFGVSFIGSATIAGTAVYIFSKQDKIWNKLKKSQTD